MNSDRSTSPINFDLTRRELLRQAGLVSVGPAVTPQDEEDSLGEQPAVRAYYTGAVAAQV